MKMASFGISDTGKVRKNNEDYYFFSEDHGLFIVADGMGGHNSGEIASEEAVMYLINELKGVNFSDLKGDLDEFIKGKIREAHNHILGIADQNIEHRGMGCTLVLMIKIQNQIHTWHVGDARAYWINKEEIIQLGSDHSYVSEMVKNGLMTREEAWSSAFKNKITMALGAPVEILPEYVTCEVGENDRIILCSDGLWDMLKDDEIRKIANKGQNAKKITLALLKKALERGGNDNITIIININFV